MREALALFALVGAVFSGTALTVLVLDDHARLTRWYGGRLWLRRERTRFAGALAAFVVALVLLVLGGDNA